MSNLESPSQSSAKVKPLSPFIAKLKLLLSDPKYEDAIRWSGNGDAIVIFDADIFKRVVLDKTVEMFKTKNFTSFVRQLNLYGFRKVPTNGKSDPNKNMKFEHPHFVQHKPNMMHHVQRTCSSSKKRKPAEILEQFGNEPQEKRTARKSESRAREKAGWLNEYYTRATTKRVQSKVSSSSTEEEETKYVAKETFDDNEGFAVEYMYQDFHEELYAVQLLMYLHYSPPNPEVFPTAVWPTAPQFSQLQTGYLVPSSTSQQFSSTTSFCRCLSCQTVSYGHLESADRAN